VKDRGRALLFFFTIATGSFLTPLGDRGGMSMLVDAPESLADLVFWVEGDTLPWIAPAIRYNSSIYTLSETEAKWEWMYVPLNLLLGVGTIIDPAEFNEDGVSTCDAMRGDELERSRGACRGELGGEMWCWLMPASWSVGLSWGCCGDEGEDKLPVADDVARGDPGAFWVGTARDGLELLRAALLATSVTARPLFFDSRFRDSA